MSLSKNPSSASTSSPALRAVIEDRSSGDGFVVETTRIWSVAWPSADPDRSSPVTSTTTPPAPRGCTDPDRRPAHRAAPNHRAGSASTRPGTCRTARRRPPKPAAGPSTHRRSTCSPAACANTQRPPCRRPLSGAGQPTPGVVPRPDGHRHHLVQDPALPPLVRSLERLGVPGGDLGPRRHRQPTLHAPRRSPLRGHSYVRHGARFARTFRESCRPLEVCRGIHENTCCVDLTRRPRHRRAGRVPSQQAVPVPEHQDRVDLAEREGVLLPGFAVPAVRPGPGPNRPRLPGVRCRRLAGIPQGVRRRYRRVGHLAEREGLLLQGRPIPAVRRRRRSGRPRIPAIDRAELARAG